MLDAINNETFYTPEELTKRFKLSLSSVYKLVRSGDIPSIRLGKVYRIAQSDLASYLKKKKTQGSVPPQVPRAATNFVEELHKWKESKRIREVYLYGSYARGDFDADSDIDLCVLVDHLDINIRSALSDIAEKVMAATDYQELLSVREEEFESWHRMKKANYPLVQNILNEGIPLWKNQ